MTTKIDQKAYLQKYLTGKSADKKKKKKKVPKGTGFKIIDDDIDLTKLRTLDGDELDILDNGEDAPQIAGIIDERPEDVRKMEQYNVNSKWRVINQDDGFNSKLKIQEIQNNVKEQEKENELIFGKMYSDSEDEIEKKNDSDASPPRKQSNSSQKTRTSKKTQNNSDSDFSPPRQKDDRKDTKESDRNTRKREASPPKKQDDQISNEKRSKNYDSDLLPPRKHDVDRSKERSRKASRWGDFEQEKKEYMSKCSTSRKKSDSDASPPRKSKKNYDSDLSPPRKSRKDSPSRYKRQQTPDSDMSPPRKRKQSPDKTQRRRKKSTDSDLSPPRKNRKESRQKSPDSEMSPPRKSRLSASRNSKNRNGDRNDSPPPSNKKMAKTLEGKVAGLQSATMLREENDAFRRREVEAFSRLADEVSGRNAQVANRRAGKRESSAERVKQKEKAERQKELDEKYKKWSKGLKQAADIEARHNDFLHESSKPLARLAGDQDLEDSLRQVERADDPMLQYVRQRKRERGDLPPEKPTYKGSFPPNRFNIRPGYRWDGVDRSSGYERKYFDTQSKRRAQEEEYFKWSSADM